MSFGEFKMQSESNTQQPSMFEQIMTEVRRGMEHKNQGTSMGLPKLESVIDGVTKSNYTLIVSNSGSGKTSLALYSMVYRPLMEHLHDDNFKVLYVSLEMSAMSMFIKLMSIYIFEKFGKKLSYKEILSRKKGYVLDEEGYKMVQQCKEFVEAVENKIEFYDKNVNASSLYAILCDRLEKMGTFTVTETRKLYTPNNPDLLYLVVIDHIALVRPQNGHTLKQEIDLTSSYLVTLREMCGISPVVIQQTNRDNGNIERYKAGKSAFTLNDAKDSGNTNNAVIFLMVFQKLR